MKLHQPVLYRAQLLQRALAGLVFQIVKQHQPHARGNRPHLGFAKPLGNLFARFLQALAHQLAREVDVHAVFEVDIDHRQTEVGDGANIVYARQPIHGNLNGVRHIGFDLFRSQSFRDGKYLHEIGGYIGEGVHGQLAIAIIPSAHHQ